MKAFILTLALAIANSTSAGGLSSAAAKALARGSERTAERAAESKVQSVLARDASRDAATPTKATTAPRTVQRFTSAADAQRAQQYGISPGQHMTSNVPRGRGVSAERAQERFGLPRKPEVVMTVEIPKATTVRNNKALDGERGRGEVASTQTISAENIKQVRPLTHRKDAAKAETMSQSND